MDNQDNKIVTFGQTNNLIDIAKQSFDKDHQKGVRLTKRAVYTMYDNKPNCDFDINDYLATLDTLYPEHINYFAQLCYQYGKLYLYDYVHYCVFKILGENMIEDRFKWKSIAQDAEQTEPYILAFIGALGEACKYTNDYYLKIIDTPDRNLKVPPVFTNLRIVTPSGNLIPAMTYMLEGYTEEEIKIAEAYMVHNDFDKAIKILKKYDPTKYPKVKTNLAISYFLNGKTQEAIDTIINNGDITFLDNTNLLLFYHDIEDKQKFESVKKQLTNIYKPDMEQCFKLGVAFCQVEEHKLGREYLGKYLNKNAQDLRAQLLYAIACMNLGEFELAKHKLQYLLDIDIYDHLVYKDYLQLCQNKELKKYEYAFDVQPKSSYKYNDLVDRLVHLNDDEFKLCIMDNLDLIGWVARSSYCEYKNLFFIKVSRIEDVKVLNLIEDVLLDRYVDDVVKHIIVKTKLEYAINFRSKIMFVTNNTLHRISMPASNIVDENTGITIYNKPKDKLKLYPTYYKAWCLAYDLILKYDDISINLNIYETRRGIIEILKHLSLPTFSEDELKYYIAAYLVNQYYETLVKRKRENIKQIKDNPLIDDNYIPPFARIMSKSSIIKFYHLDKDRYQQLENEVERLLALS